MSHQITPTPTDEEAAAIAAALMMVFNSQSAPGAPPVVSTEWRFSGRPLNRAWGRTGWS